MCSPSQTEKVIVIEDEAEILDVIASRKNKLVDSAEYKQRTQLIQIETIYRTPLTTSASKAIQRTCLLCPQN